MNRGHHALGIALVLAAAWGGWNHARAERLYIAANEALSLLCSDSEREPYPAVCGPLPVEADALHCARTGEGTDQSIADCYTTRGLPCPEDICSPE